MSAIPLSPRELRIIEPLRLNPKRAFRGVVRGDRLSKRKGISIEFADYREYSDGDDLRHLDWNVLARLDTPVMRTYRDEEDLNVYVCIDASPSMQFGEPAKFDYAKRLACALGYVALAGGDTLVPRWLGPKSAPIGNLRGRSNITRLSHWLTLVAQAEAPSSPLDSMRLLLKSNARPGLLILLSDGLDPQYPGLINSLGSRGFEIAMIQILTDVELDPDLEGDLKLVDSEGGAPREITANRRTIELYRQRLEKHNADLATAISKVSGKYVMTTTSESLEDLLNQKLKRGGWFQ